MHANALQTLYFNEVYTLDVGLRACPHVATFLEDFSPFLKLASTR